MENPTSTPYYILCTTVALYDYHQKRVAALYALIKSSFLVSFLMFMFLKTKTIVKLRVMFGVKLILNLEVKTEVPDKL